VHPASRWSEVVLSAVHSAGSMACADARMTERNVVTTMRAAKIRERMGVVASYRPLRMTGHRTDKEWWAGRGYQCLLWVKADMCSARGHVRQGPEVDIPRRTNMFPLTPKVDNRAIANIMTLAIAGFMLIAISCFSVWRVANRFWHALVIVVLATLLFPLVATQISGDVSRYLPTGTFSEGADGKDQIVLASAMATALIAVILAACVWGAGKTAWL